MGNLLPLNISINQGSTDSEEAGGCLDVHRTFEFGTAAVGRRWYRIGGGGGHTISPVSRSSGSGPRRTRANSGLQTHTVLIRPIGHGSKRVVPGTRLAR